MFEGKANAIKLTLFIALIFLVLLLVLSTHISNVKRQRFEFEATAKCAPGFLYKYEMDTGRAVCVTSGKYKVIYVNLGGRCVLQNTK